MCAKVLSLTGKMLNIVAEVPDVAAKVPMLLAMEASNDAVPQTSDCLLKNAKVSLQTWQESQQKNLMKQISLRETLTKHSLSQACLR